MRLAVGALVLLLLVAGAWAQGFATYSGHGGPIMGVAVSPDGKRLLTASFDNSVGLWGLEDGSGPVWLEGHEAAVNCVLFLPDGRVASGGDDFQILIRDPDSAKPMWRLKGHRGKIMALAASSDGARLASASWDGSVLLWNLVTGAQLGALSGHSAGVNDVLWSGDGTQLYTASTDGTVMVWDATTRTTLLRLAAHGFGVNVLALNEAAGWIAYGAVDGGVRAVSLATGEEVADLTSERRPILGMALSPDGTRLAVGDGHGWITVIDTMTWRIERDFHAALNGPIWALAFTGDGSALIAGGIADEAFRWPLDGSDSRPRVSELRRQFHVDPGKVTNGERQFLRKCSICHTLGAEGERRAGPPLAGLFGRVAGSVPGYSYSQAVQGSGVVWSDETIDRLFDLGPERFIPGTKMPMQVIARPEDRSDLIDFLRRETALP